MISLIENRPVLQVGRHQIYEYDTAWLDHALQRAAKAADRQDFPFLREIRQGIEEYLSTKCSLELLPLPTLYARMRRMLEKIGCRLIAEKLELLAPPITLDLSQIARVAGNGYELAFFECLRSELDELRDTGVEEVRFTGLKTAILQLLQREDWDSHCDQLLSDIRSFLDRQDREQVATIRPLRLELDEESVR